MAKIFISYRRSDAQDVAGRIYDRLVERFSRDNVFKDVDSIPLSVAFPEHLERTLGISNAVLVLIGPSWMTCRDDSGLRRLDDPSDFVRLEIETALRFGIPTIPVPVSNAQVPRKSDLPESLKSLADRHGQPVRSDPDFHRDMDRLIEGLVELVGSDGGGKPSQINKTLLHDLLDAVQKWHDEIVETAAQLLGEDDQGKASRLQFTYVNTRKYLPRVLSIQKVLKQDDTLADLLRHVDQFVGLLTYEQGHSNEPEETSPVALLTYKKDDASPVALLTYTKDRGKDAEDVPPAAFAANEGTVESRGEQQSPSPDGLGKFLERFPANTTAYCECLNVKLNLFGGIDARGGMSPNVVMVGQHDLTAVQTALQAISDEIIRLLSHTEF